MTLCLGAIGKRGKLTGICIWAIGRPIIHHVTLLLVNITYYWAEFWPDPLLRRFNRFRVPFLKCLTSPRPIPRFAYLNYPLTRYFGNSPFTWSIYDISKCGFRVFYALYSSITLGRSANCVTDWTYCYFKGAYFLILNLLPNPSKDLLVLPKASRLIHTISGVFKSTIITPQYGFRWKLGANSFNWVIIGLRSLGLGVIWTSFARRPRRKASAISISSFEKLIFVWT